MTKTLFKLNVKKRFISQPCANFFLSPESKKRFIQNACENNLPQTGIGACKLGIPLGIHSIIIQSNLLSANF